MNLFSAAGWNWTYITEKYKLVFPDDEETETLSGYIIKNHEHIPKLKDAYHYWQLRN